jgi:hypothetical protein
MLNVLSSFAELYKSFGPVNLTVFFEMFDNLTTPAPAARFTRYLSTSDDTAKVLVYEMGTVDSPRVGVMHGLFKFLPSMTGPSLWDGHIYAIEDDIVDSSRAVTTLSIPGAIFNKTVAIVVPVVGSMDAMWAAHNTATPDVACLAPMVAAADTESRQQPRTHGRPHDLPSQHFPGRSH